MAGICHAEESTASSSWEIRAQDRPELPPVPKGSSLRWEVTQPRVTPLGSRAQHTLNTINNPSLAPATRGLSPISLGRPGEAQSFLVRSLISILRIILMFSSSTCCSTAAKAWAPPSRCRSSSSSTYPTQTQLGQPVPQQWVGGGGTGGAAGGSPLSPSGLAVLLSLPGGSEVPPAFAVVSERSRGLQGCGVPLGLFGGCREERAMWGGCCTPKSATGTPCCQCTPPPTTVTPCTAKSPFLHPQFLPPLCPPQPHPQRIPTPLSPHSLPILSSPPRPPFPPAPPRAPPVRPCPPVLAHISLPAPHCPSQGLPRAPSIPSTPCPPCCPPVSPLSPLTPRRAPASPRAPRSSIRPQRPGPAPTMSDSPVSQWQSGTPSGAGVAGNVGAMSIRGWGQKGGSGGGTAT